MLTVKASIITQTGGTCVCTNTLDPACYTDTEYAACLIGRWVFQEAKLQLLMSTEVNRDLITATAAIAGIGSFMFGFLTNLPVALA
jgi:AGZA family xanthine/uracil permease-like MFS transporter